MLLGRATECARIDGLLAGARLGTSGVLVLDGEPGVGKTTLLDYAREQAAGMALLQARGVEPEAGVPFGGLLALLRPALGLLDEIPRPQAAALRTALALDTGGERDRFAIGAATLSLLAAHAERRPVLVVVDDAHWLDEPSLAAVTFAAGRLLADAVAVLVATRPGVARPSLPTLTLGGLDRAAAADVLERRAGRALPPGAADRVYALTLGNPLALVELAGAAEHVAAEPPLPIETTVERVFSQRVAVLPEPTRRALFLAAAEGSGDLAALQRAAPAVGVDLAALDAAERAGLTTSGPGTVAFVHPLARSAAYRSTSAAERRAAHRALAAAPGDPDRRARHLAAAAVGPDAEAARALEAAGRRARARSAYAAAARAFEHAARLTADGADRARRLLAAADAAWLAGDAEHVDRLLHDAREAGPDPALVPEIDHLRGHAALRAGRVVEAHDILCAAAATAPARAVAMLAEAADACAYAARPGPMLAAAQGAWAALAGDADAPERDRFYASLALGMALIYNGRGEEGADRVRVAVGILENSEVLSGDPRILASAALGPLWLRDQAQGRALVARAMDAARDAGALGALPFSLWLAARDAATSDRWAIAEALYEEAIRLARETGQATALCAGLAGLACVYARQGREPECRALAAEALELTARLGLDFFGLWALDALAELELGLGHVAAAVARLEEKEVLLAARGVEDPDVSPVPELVEALTRLDRAGEARERLAQYARRAAAKRQPWALARVARCEGLLGDDDGAGTGFAEALRLHALTPDRFEEARTRLCHGERLRRDRRRTDARAELRRALEIFDELGAAPWGERARVELLATGETARRRDPSTLDQLTPRELQVALVLAEGDTIREAAAKLYLSPKTVDYHLRHVYRKLGIRSRDALPAALAGPGAQPQEAT